MEQIGGSGHRVVATFPTLEAGRQAIVSLERHGVGGSIHMHRRDEPQDVDAPYGEESRVRDVRMTGDLGKGAVQGFLIGALLGGAIAAVVAFFVVDADDRVPAALTSFLAAGLLFGAIGALIRVFSKVPNDVDDWERTFDDDPGLPVEVEVVSADGSEVESAAKVLHGLGPSRVEAFDPSGRRLSV